MLGPGEGPAECTKHGEWRRASLLSADVAVAVSRHLAGIGGPSPVAPRMLKGAQSRWVARASASYVPGDFPVRYLVPQIRSCIAVSPALWKWMTLPSRNFNTSAWSEDSPSTEMLVSTTTRSSS